MTIKIVGFLPVFRNCTPMVLYWLETAVALNQGLHLTKKILISLRIVLNLT